jgi:hypothetical protein
MKFVGNGVEKPGPDKERPPAMGEKLVEEERSCKSTPYPRSTSPHEGASF